MPRKATPINVKMERVIEEITAELCLRKNLTDAQKVKVLEALNQAYSTASQWVKK